MRHQFLSEGWLEAVATLREVEVVPSNRGPQINLKIAEHPFGSEVLKLHVGNDQTQLLFGTGLLPAPDLELTMSYSVAKELFLGQDPDAVMTSFMDGDIKVRGDITTLIAGFARQQASEEALRLLELVLAITVEED